MPTQSNIAIIPARGGSKRIPKKNIKSFLGKPIIAYSIETALASKLFSKVVVSTDDDEIKKIARDFGAECPFVRPSDLADDFATTVDVIAHAIAELMSQGISPEYVCCLYATAPFVKTEDLYKGFELVSKPGIDFAFSATEFPFPVQRGFTLSDQLGVDMPYPEHLLTRSQDLPKVFHDAGQFYWGKTDSFVNQKPVFSPSSRAVLLPRLRTQDIDTPEDWSIAETLYKLNASNPIE